MAAAVGGLSTCFTCPSVKSLAPSTSYSAHVRVFFTRLVLQRGCSWCPRCEIDDPNSSSVRSNRIGMPAAGHSALELLKTSSVDRYTRERSNIMVIGLNVHTAPVELREKLAIPEAQWPQAIGELCALNHIEEAAVLSTCNRIEIYVEALSQHHGVKEVTEWMSKKSGFPISEICKHRVLLYNKDATQHLFEVSAGLDSLVLGEGKILAQVNHVVKTGQGVAGFDRKISGLFKHAISVGMRVRTETNISSGSVSVSSAAVELAQKKLSESSCAAAEVMVVGAGKMGKLVIKHLIAKGCKKMMVVNRTRHSVDALSKEQKDVEIIYKPLSEILACAAKSDVIFTCTASKTPLLMKEPVAKLPPARTETGRRLFIDISVPRNVEPCVSDLDTVSVFNVDDLKEVVAANKEDRLQKVQEAQLIITEEMNKFEAWKDSLETVPTIKKFRAYVERIGASELDKCLSKIGEDNSKKTKVAINDLSLGIAKKLLNGPIQHLRCDGIDSRTLDEILQNMHAINENAPHVPLPSLVCPLSSGIGVSWSHSLLLLFC